MTRQLVNSQSRWIDESSISAVTQLLQDTGVLDRDESVAAITRAGDGNMNVTLRVTTARRSVIVKQSRPFVAKYEFIPAPEDRIHFEASFYEFVRREPRLAAAMPQLLAWLPESNVLVLEDLGSSSDATSLYEQHSPDVADLILSPLADWLQLLHRTSREAADTVRCRNRELRSLNHAHIFVIPFQDAPAVDLDAVCPRLADATVDVRTNESLRTVCRELGERYLSDGDCLLHGDFYPGSWLLTNRGPYVIDPEFCFFGPPEFDYGVFLAHLQFCGPDRARRFRMELLRDADERLDRKLVSQFAAVEVLRRLLGVAQLPLKRDLQARLALIEEAEATLCG